jgi:hypothetical protein
LNSLASALLWFLPELNIDAVNVPYVSISSPAAEAAAVVMPLESDAIQTRWAAM